MRLYTMLGYNIQVFYDGTRPRKYYPPIYDHGATCSALINERYVA